MHAQQPDGITAGDSNSATHADELVLGANQYGKAEVRLVHVDRSAPRHRLSDLSVTSQLHGDFTRAHTHGDNAAVVTTDTQKNTVFALARGGTGSPEAFGIRLADHFTSSFDWVTGGRWAIESYTWDHIPTTRTAHASGGRHEHSFVRGGTETRTAVVHREQGRTVVFAGLRDLAVLKTTGSEFHGFPNDRFTTLAETRDRILATSVTARWRYIDVPGEEGSDDRGTIAPDFDARYERVRNLLLETFADVHSLALQQTLYEMGRAVLAEVEQIAEIRLSMPNLHHFLVDLEPFGLDNSDEIYFAADRPYGLIEAEVRRESIPPDPAAWAAVTGFC